jgi:hypothetical protein
MRVFWPSASASKRLRGVVLHRYRSVEVMPPAWRSADDPGNLGLVAQMLSLYRRFDNSERRPGVRRFRALEEANADRGDPFRNGVSPADPEGTGIRGGGQIRTPE